MELFAICSSSVTKIPGIKGLLAVGGSSSTGIKLSGLKATDNYAVLGTSPEGIFVHLLKGKKQNQVLLQENKPLTIEDLTLFIAPSSSQQVGSQVSTEMEELLKHFSGAESLAQPLERFLHYLLDAAEMEKGVMIARDHSGAFVPFVMKELKDGDLWLSEAMVKEVLTGGRPVWIHNRVGSAFESSKSLVAAGFLSAFAIPLQARGEILGMVVVGSTRPHGGLSEEKRNHLESLARIGSLLFWLQRRDELAQIQIARLEKTSHSNCPMLTVSAKLGHEIEIAKRIAATRLSVLVQGETGVGKELMAQWIHQESDRKKGPFIALNCAAIPSELLESILFGHKRGAFTGAVNDQLGKFQLADGGTLLLDEIGDLSERLQGKLLRVLQEGLVEPVGSNKAQKVDVRVISATHRALGDLVKKGSFRQDLYFRLAETVVSIPALRERPEDIAMLAVHFLKAAAPEKRMETDTLAWLSHLEWPGNVRELQSAVRRAAALSTGKEIRKEAFLLGLPRNQTTEADSNWLGGSTLEEARNLFVREKIKLALDRTEGNRQRAADLLGITSRTLFRYLEEDRESRQDFHDARH